MAVLGDERGLCMSGIISSLAPFCGRYSQIKFKEEPREKKLSSPFIFWRKDIA